MKQVKRVLTVFALLITAAVNAQSTLNVKVFFQGFYNPNTQTMRAVIDPLNNPTQFDNVTVKLADATTGSVQFTTQAIADVNGNVQVTVPSALDGNSFYIVINHRNCLETWSSNPIVMNTGTSYDFTTSQSAAYGANMYWSTNAACIYSGDINQDKVIDVMDFLILDASVQSGSFAYYLTPDLNGDSAVDVLDYVTLDENLQQGVWVITPFITSVEEGIVDAGIELFPNPSTSDLYIKSEKYNDQWINIYDINGQLLFSELKNSEVIHIDVINWTPGLYILITESGEEKKFQVIH